MTDEETLVSQVTADVARLSGVAINPDDPLVAAVLMNRAVLSHYLTLTLAPIKEAIADAVTQAQRGLTAHVHEQTQYVEQQLLKDREKFVNAQKAALEDFEERLLQRDAALTKITAEMLNKAGLQLAAKFANGQQKGHIDPMTNKKWRPAYGALALGVAAGVMGSVGGLFIAALYIQNV